MNIEMISDRSSPTLSAKSKKMVKWKDGENETDLATVLQEKVTESVSRRTSLSDLSALTNSWSKELKKLKSYQILIYHKGKWKCVDKTSKLTDIPNLKEVKKETFTTLLLAIQNLSTANPFESLEYLHILMTSKWGEKRGKGNKLVDTVYQQSIKGIVESLGFIYQGQLAKLTRKEIERYPQFSNKVDSYSLFFPNFYEWKQVDQIVMNRFKAEVASKDSKIRQATLKSLIKIIHGCLSDKNFAGAQTIHSVYTAPSTRAFALSVKAVENDEENKKLVESNKKFITNLSIDFILNNGQNPCYRYPPIYSLDYFIQAFTDSYLCDSTQSDLEHLIQIELSSVIEEIKENVNFIDEIQQSTEGRETFRQNYLSRIQEECQSFNSQVKGQFKSSFQLINKEKFSQSALEMPGKESRAYFELKYELENLIELIYQTKKLSLDLKNEFFGSETEAEKKLRDDLGSQRDQRGQVQATILKEMEAKKEDRLRNCDPSVKELFNKIISTKAFENVVQPDFKKELNARIKQQYELELKNNLIVKINRCLIEFLTNSENDDNSLISETFLNFLSNEVKQYVQHGLQQEGKKEKLSTKGLTSQQISLKTRLNRVKFIKSLLIYPVYSEEAIEEEKEKLKTTLLLLKNYQDNLKQRFDDLKTQSIREIGTRRSSINFNPSDHPLIQIGENLLKIFGAKIVGSEKRKEATDYLELQIKLAKKGITTKRTNHFIESILMEIKTGLIDIRQEEQKFNSQEENFITEANLFEVSFDV